MYTYEDSNQKMCYVSFRKKYILNLFFVNMNFFYVHLYQLLILFLKKQTNKKQQQIDHMGFQPTSI